MSENFRRVVSLGASRSPKAEVCSSTVRCSWLVHTSWPALRRARAAPPFSRASSRWTESMSWFLDSTSLCDVRSRPCSSTSSCRSSVSFACCLCTPKTKCWSATKRLQPMAASTHWLRASPLQRLPQRSTCVHILPLQVVKGKIFSPASVTKPGHALAAVREPEAKI